jgi:hypothetical protein
VRQEPEYFGEEELQLVYVAARLNEAKKLERILTERSLDYLVEPDTYTGGVVFRTERVGAFFYVRKTDLERVRETMKANNYRPIQP